MRPFLLYLPRKGQMYFKKISLDEMGLCRECILLDLLENGKKSIKKRMRIEFEERINGLSNTIKKCLHV